jgi:DNA sulfur modification protein DndC
MPKTSEPNLESYDLFLVGLSGGKDSIACALELLDRGVPAHKIECWHHLIDGREGEGLMDWESTPAYCRAFAKAFGFGYYESWREGGFVREMTRHNERTAKTWFETPSGLESAGGVLGSLNTREQFPQVGGTLTTRWCSSSLKIDVMSIAINNQKRLLGKRILVITGERALESESRAKYAKFEDHKCNTKSRTVHTWRAVHSWTEAQVWAKLEKHSVNPHPAYRLGWSRLSCMTCIFGNADQWRSVAEIAPERLEVIANFEAAFGKTIDRHTDVLSKAARGTAYAGCSDRALVAESRDSGWNGQIRTSNWRLPAGAFKKGCGPS